MGTVCSTVDTSMEILHFRYTDLVCSSRITTCFVLSKKKHSAYAVERNNGLFTSRTIWKTYIACVGKMQCL